MATLQSLTANPTTVEPGASSTITVTFNVASGTPDVVAHVAVLLDGGQQGSTDITLKGQPAESTPVVSAGSTNVGWEIRTDAGTLTPTGNNTFSLLNG